MGWADGEINNAPFKYADINGVDNTGNAIQFVNNIDGGNILTIHGRFNYQEHLKLFTQA